MTESTQRKILAHLEAIRESIGVIHADMRDITQILDRLELRLTISG